MYKHIVKMECLTGLHVGSGDVNYNIVDNEVERDPVTGRAVIHSSGVKGAFRDAYIAASGENLKKIFGSAGEKNAFTTGTYKFLGAEILVRPLRASGTGMASVPVTTIDAVNSYLKLLSGFDCNHYGIDKIVYDGEYTFLARDTRLCIEGKKAAVMPEKLASQLDKLKDILPENTVIAKDLSDYPLPVIARNCLENGKSVNLWYEEYVPQTSIFYTLILADEEMLDPALGIGDVVQFGGNNSIGYGYMKLSELGR